VESGPYERSRPPQRCGGAEARELSRLWRGIARGQSRCEADISSLSNSGRTFAFPKRPEASLVEGERLRRSHDPGFERRLKRRRRERGQESQEGTLSREREADLIAEQTLERRRRFPFGDGAEEAQEGTAAREGPRRVVRLEALEAKTPGEDRGASAPTDLRRREP
jgi:hypothetical protein